MKSKTLDQLSAFFDLNNCLTILKVSTLLIHVGHLAVGAFGCYSVLNTLPLIFKKKKIYKIKAIKMVRELLKLAKQSCNM